MEGCWIIIYKYLIAWLWSRGKVSSGKASQKLGMTRIDFLEWAGKRFTYPYTIEELKQDFKFAEKEEPNE